MFHQQVLRCNTAAQCVVGLKYCTHIPQVCSVMPMLDLIILHAVCIRSFIYYLFKMVFYFCLHVFTLHNRRRVLINIRNEFDLRVCFVYIQDWIKQYCYMFTIPLWMVLLIAIWISYDGRLKMIKMSWTKCTL